MKNNQFGRSMIEMLGVLSIIGVLSVGGFGMVKKMQNSYDTNKIMEEISSFVRKARIVTREYETTTDGLNKYLYDGKAYPDGVEYDATAKNFSGTSGVVYSFAQGADSKILFTLTISSLPEEVCMQVATADWGNSASSGFKGIKISTTTSVTPLSLGEAADVCSDGASVELSFR